MKIQLSAKCLLWFALLCCGTNAASQEFQLRGRYGACQDNQKMGLWDISAGSPLIRDDMVRSNFCWHTIPGIRIRVNNYVGKFARVENLAGSKQYLVYRSDLEKIPEDASIAQDLSNRELTKFRSVTVRNVIETGEVYDIRGKPTAQIVIQVDSKLRIYFSIVKSAVTPGFDVRIQDQLSAYLQMGGKCDKSILGVGPPDFYRVKVEELDMQRRRAVLHVSGSLAKCSIDFPRGYKFDDVEVIVAGKNFDELMRPHTSKELSKRFVPFKW